MKTLVIATLFLFAASLTAFAASIDGKWISEREVGAADGKTYTHTTTLTFKNDGGLLTGTVEQISAAPWMAETNGRSIEIRDGKIDGDKWLVWGRGWGGRLLQVIFVVDPADTIYVIHARPLTEQENRRLRRAQR